MRRANIDLAADFRVSLENQGAPREMGSRQILESLVGLRAQLRIPDRAASRGDLEARNDAAHAMSHQQHVVLATVNLIERGHFFAEPERRVGGRPSGGIIKEEELILVP